jgi:hypothetical protein
VPDPITPHAWDDLDDQFKVVLCDAVDEALRTLTRELYGTVDSILDLEGQPPALQRDYHLARVAAAAMITEHLRAKTTSDGYMAGGVTGAALTYADLGRAAGIARETASKRWPGALPDAKPGRPRAQVTVKLVGGPPQWDGQRLEMDYSDVYDSELDGVGGYLVIPDGSFPDHLAAEGGAAVDWRAHYAPTSEDTRTVWTFQGWVPS